MKEKRVQLPEVPWHLSKNARPSGDFRQLVRKIAKTYGIQVLWSEEVRLEMRGARKTRRSGDDRRRHLTERVRCRVAWQRR